MVATVLPTVSVRSNYISAGGVLTIAPRDSTGPLGAFDPGNVPSVTVTRAVETTTHVESRSGTFQTDSTRVKSVTTTIKAILESMTLENYALFMGADVEDRTTGSSAVAAGDEDWRGARPGSTFYFGSTATYPEGYKTITSFASLVVKAAAHATSTAVTVGTVVSNTTEVYVYTVAGTTGASAPTFPTAGATAADGTATIKHLGPKAIAGTEYEYCLAPAVLTLKGAAGTNLVTSMGRMPAGYYLTLSPAYTPTAVTYQRLKPRAVATEYFIRFNGQTAEGTPLHFVAPYCTIAGDGDSEWINSENPQQFSVTITALKRDSANEAIIPFGATAALPWS